MTRFSVVIPTRDRRTLVEEALRSVREQDFGELVEIIVVDDGSSDDTAEYLAGLGGTVTVIPGAARGPGAARNLGMKAARGEYICFLDSDDLWFRWTARTYDDVIRQTSRPAFVAGSPFRFTSPDELRACSPSAVQYDVFEDYLSSGDRRRWWGASSFVVRTDAARAAGGFLEENVNGEDADFALRLGTSAGFVHITGPATFGYRQHPGNIMFDTLKGTRGITLIVQSERAGRYSGGPRRARQRWQIITRHLRPVTLELLILGHYRESLRLFLLSLRWHLALRRWRYLFAYPVRVISALINSRKGVQDAES